MKYKWTLSAKHTFFIIIYSMIFPFTNLLGGKMMAVGIVLSFPFLPIAWIGGMCFVWVMGTEKVYIFGAFITILLQTWLVMTNWQNARRRRMDQFKIMPTGIDEIDMDESKKTK